MSKRYLLGFRASNCKDLHEDNILVRQQKKKLRSNELFVIKPLDLYQHLNYVILCQKLQCVIIIKCIENSIRGNLRSINLFANLIVKQGVFSTQSKEDGYIAKPRSAQRALILSSTRPRLNWHYRDRLNILGAYIKALCVELLQQTVAIIQINIPFQRVKVQTNSDYVSVSIKVFW